MNCHTAQSSISAYLDGGLSGEARRELLLHARGCRECESRMEQTTRVRQALRNLPTAVPPAQLTTALRVMASKERERVLSRQTRLEAFASKAHLWIENLMRPMALPFAGGFVSALLLFAMLIPTLAFRRSGAIVDDVPVGFITEPTIKAQMPFAFDNDTDILVEVLVDGQGRMADYTIANEESVANNPALRRAIENKLIMTEFTPATMFGAPTLGKMYVVFQRQQIDIKS